VYGSQRVLKTASWAAWPGFSGDGKALEAAALGTASGGAFAGFAGQAYLGGSMGKRNERIALFLLTGEGGVGLQKVGRGGWLRLARKGDWRAGDGDLGMLIGFQESGRGYFRVGGNTIGT
jgi:hypothetical protein